MSGVVSGPDRDALAELLLPEVPCANHDRDYGGCVDCMGDAERYADAILAAGWLPPTEPTAHLPRCREYPTGWLCEAACEFVWKSEPTAGHAGDTDDATVLAVSSALDYMRSAVLHGPGTYAPEGWHATCERFIAAWDAAQPVVVPDRDETDLRAAGRALVEKWYAESGAATPEGQGFASASRLCADELDAVLGDPAGTLAEHNAKVRAEALDEFAQWVASHRAYNGSDHRHGQALYDECLNGVLREWAGEWLRERAAVTR